MARPRKLAVRITAKASRDLDSIWQWNATAYGPAHADRYIEFVLEEIMGLCTKYELGRLVKSRPSTRSYQVRKGSARHGHVAIFRIVGETLEVLHVFHSAQDWRKRLSDE